MTETTDEYGWSLQLLLDTGDAWRLPGSVGRAAMAALDDGTCVLPLEPHTDYWGNRVPGRGELAEGSKGTVAYANARRAERGLPPLIVNDDGTVGE